MLVELFVYKKREHANLYSNLKVLGKPVTQKIDSCPRICVEATMQSLVLLLANFLGSQVTR